MQHEQHIIMFLLKYYSVIGTYCFFFLSFMLLGLFLPASSFPFLYHLMLGAGIPATISHFRMVFFPSSTVMLRRSFSLGSAETKTQNRKQKLPTEFHRPSQVWILQYFTPFKLYFYCRGIWGEALLNCDEMMSKNTKRKYFFFFAKYYSNVLWVSGTHTAVLSVKKCIIPDICFNRSLQLFNHKPHP